MISIIIPLYNKENTISRTIESILSQTSQDWELIVVNDGSKDNSSTVVEKYLDDKRIFLINKENGGVSSARNKGLLESKGDWIIFLDADDYLMPNSLAIFEKVIERGDASAIIANFYMSKDGISKKYSNHKKTGNIRNYLLDWIKGDICPRCGATLYKKNIVSGHLFDERISRNEDVKFSLEVLHGVSVQYISEPVMIYDQETLNLSQILNPKKDYVYYVKLNEYSFWEKVFVSEHINIGMKRYPQDKEKIRKQNKGLFYYLIVNHIICYQNRLMKKLFQR